MELESALAAAKALQRARDVEDARLARLEETKAATAISPLPLDVEPSIAYHDDDYEEEMDEGHSLDPCLAPIAASASSAATQSERSSAGVVSDATDVAARTLTTVEHGDASYTMPSTTVGATAGRVASTAITDIQEPG